MKAFILHIFCVCTLIHTASAQVESSAGAAAASLSDSSGMRSARPKLFAAVLFGAANNTVGMSRRVGVFVRPDGDTSWTVAPNANTMSFGAGYSVKNGAPRYYVCGGNGLFRSDDRGASWRMLTNWRTMEVLAVAIDPVNPVVIYIATPFGVFRSMDDGVTWKESIGGMKKWFVQTVFMDSNDPSRLFAAAEDDLYLSTNRGEKWTPLHCGVKEVRAALQHPRNPAILVVGTEDEGVRFTHDGGKTWNTGRGTEGKTFLAFAASRDGKNMYAAGFKTGVWKSDDDGRSWSCISGALPVEAVYSLLVHPGDPNHLYLGGEGAGLLESTDAGVTWRRTGLAGMHIMQISMFP